MPYDNNEKGIFKIRTISYPIGDLIWTFAWGLFALCIVAYLDSSTRFGFVLAACAWPVLYYFFSVQYSLTRIVFFNDRLRKEFICSFYLKDKEIIFSDISLAFFQFHISGRYGNPLVFIYLKSSKKKILIRMPKHELEQIRHELKDLGLNVKTAKHAFDRSSNYLNDN